MGNYNFNMSKNQIVYIVIMTILLFVFNTESRSKFLKRTLNIKSDSLLELTEIQKSKAIEAFCFLNSNGTVYDLNPLHNKTKDYTSKDKKYTMHYNFCQKAHTQCKEKNTTALAVLVENENPSNCYSLGGSKSTMSKWSFKEDTKTNTTSLELTLSQGDPCLVDPTRNFETKFEIICDEKATAPIIDQSTSFNSSSCTNKIKINSKEACPNFSLYSMFNTIVTNKYIFGPLLIILGIFLCFMGIAFYDALALISGVLLVSFVVLFLILSNINVTLSTIAFWITLSLVLISGIIVGYLFIKYELKWIVDLAIAGFAGYLLGVFLYNFLFNQISSHPKIVYFSCIVFSIIGLEFLVLMFRRFVIILSTSFIGAYSLIRGLSLMIGGFPSEGMVVDLIEKKEWEQLKLLLTNSVYMYLIGMVICFFAGNIVQWVYFKDDKDEKEKNDKNKGNLTDESISLKNKE